MYGEELGVISARASTEVSFGGSVTSILSGDRSAHRWVSFVAPEGQGQGIQIVARQSRDREQCEQTSNALEYAYANPRIGRLSAEEDPRDPLFTLITLEGVLAAPESGRLDPLNGGSFGASSQPALPNVVRVFDLVNSANVDPWSLVGDSQVCVPTPNANGRDPAFPSEAMQYSHDKIVCRVARKNGTVVVDVGTEGSPELVQRSNAKM